MQLEEVDLNRLGLRINLLQKSFQNTFIFQKGNVNKAELCTYHFKNVLFNRRELGGGKRFIILMPAVGGA